MSEDGIIYVWRELYGQDGDLPNVGAKHDAKEVARRVKEIEKHDHRYGYEYKMNLADPSIFTKIGTENSIGGIFKASGVKWLPAWNAKGSRRLGAQTIVQLLAEGRLKVFSTCKNFIRTVPTLPPDDYDPEDVNTECEDHIWDACRYGVMRKRRAPNADEAVNDRVQSGAVMGSNSIAFDVKDYQPDF